MEGAAPDGGCGGPDDALCAFEHFLRGAVGEGEQQDAPWLDAALDEVGDAVHEGARLAGAGGSQHEHGPVAGCRRFKLLWIEQFREVRHSAPRQMPFFTMSEASTA